MSRTPSLRQQWVLKIGKQNDMVSSFALSNGSTIFCPLSGRLDHEVKSFMSRMVKSGWLYDDRPGFYRLTKKSYEWLAHNQLTPEYHKLLSPQKSTP